MSDLLNEVRTSFEQIPEVTGVKQVSGPVGIVGFSGPDDLVPGFRGMQAYNNDRIKVMVRRGYRHFAGRDLPELSEEAFELVRPVLSPLFALLIIEAFCDGVQVGQNTSHTVRMAVFFEKVDELFTDKAFRNDSGVMALHFAGEPEVLDFFNTYTQGAVMALAHGTGFVHNNGEPNKIWDLWMLAGTSMVTAGYIAGHQLGLAWSLKDTIAEMENELGEESDDNSQ